ncbi:GNAT family N-acetyltransferase [Patescibacteria group bacterium]|nr:GNAT family N-acetyltransferase [Patescibacteria group bacterium]
MNITQLKQNNSQIKNFENKEWKFSDIEHYGKDNKYFKKSYKFAAQDDNENIVGIIEVIIEPNVALLEAILVDHQLKRQGIGKKLIEYAEMFAKQQKCSKIYLETNEGWGAEEFYKKMGYEITGKHKNHVYGQTGLIFTKFF